MPRIVQSKPIVFVEPVRTNDAHEQITVTKLSEDQRAVYDGTMTWLNRGTATKQILKLAGCAGTGKSALVSLLAHEMPSPLAFCAFTGKASSVLGRKLAASGIATVNRIVSAKDALTGARPFEPRPYCGTIHGLVFRPCDACMVEKVYVHTYGDGCTADMDDDLVVEGAVVVPSNIGGRCLACDPPPPVKREGHCSRCNDGRYLRRERLDRTYKLIVIDEASMVSDDMLAALKSYGIPILAVGDHKQLQPVGATGSLMRDPDFRLETIHRQAAGNPIIALSARIRATGDIDDALDDGEAFTIIAQRNLNDWIAKRFTPARLQADPTTAAGIMSTVLVAWTNKARVGLNYDVRAALGLGRHDAPTKGEALICLKNAAPIYNGMRGVLRSDAMQAGDAEGKAPKFKVTVDFTEDNQVAENILVSEDQFFQEKTIDYDKACGMGVSMAQLGGLYDFGYGLTCHKMQGSQAAEVGVVVEGYMSRMPKEDRTRWLYTACTRAASRLTVIR